MKVALAQINAYLGDFAANRKNSEEFMLRAAAEGCDLIVFPEASLFGYHPCDLLERPSTVLRQLKELRALHRKVPKGVAVVVGVIGLNQAREGKPFRNAAVWLERGKRPRWFAKQLLPTYDVFDEGRHIEPGRIRDNVLQWRGRRILVTICEDIWAWPEKAKPRFASYQRNPLKEVKGKVDLVINLSASPFTATKMKQRLRVVGATARHFKCPLIYVNMVGAQDELIFDGGSMVVDRNGRVVSQCRRFVEDLVVTEVVAKAKQPTAAGPSIEILRQAIVLGLRDFARKCGFSRFHFGLSGGIDSAVVACLAVDALGPENVTAVGLPGPFSAPESLTLARTLARNLGIKWAEVSIDGIYKSLVAELNRALGAIPFGVSHENLQARIRAIVLMAIANRENSLLLATSNKSELATGYSTLYGDMCGGLMPIGDLVKREVYELAEHYNRTRPVIPVETISRAPSAELKPNQRDEDSLPKYELLDPIVEKLVEGYRPARGPTEARVLEMLIKSEFKRWQAPPILKLSDHAFGRGRRLPLAHRSWD